MAKRIASFSSILLLKSHIYIKHTWGCIFKMLTRLFATSDGKIPFLQILVGVIIGAIGMFVYAKFWKPKLLFDHKLPLSSPSQEPFRETQQFVVRSPTHNRGNEEASTVVPADVVEPNGQYEDPNSQPAYIEIQQVSMPSMPNLTPIYEAQEEFSQSEEETDEEDDNRRE
jgi:hypothetical protein